MIDYIRALDIIEVSIFALNVIFTAAVTVFIFCYRSKEQRPTFVVWSTIFLNFFCIFYVIYFSLVVLDMVSQDGSDKSVPKQTRTENIFATLGNFFMVSHDWIFTEQHIMASLNLPIVIQIFDTDAGERPSRHNPALKAESMKRKA